MSASRRWAPPTVGDRRGARGDASAPTPGLDVGSAANDNAAAIVASEREAMSVEEVAAFLGVDRKTVYDYAGRGMIPCRRLGKRILFSRRALVLWLGGECSKGWSNGETL